MPEYIDTLICDAVRPEPNNKMTVLGLLGDEIFVPQIPALLGSLAFIQRWKPSEGEQAGASFMFSFELHGPGMPAPILIAPRASIVPRNARTQMNFVVQVQGFSVQREGEYELRTNIDGMQRHRHPFSIHGPPAGP